MPARQGHTRFAHPTRFRPQTETSIKDYYIAFTILVLALIAFGGYVAPMAEVKLGLGCAGLVWSAQALTHVLIVDRGTSYAEFVASLGLPKQMSEARCAWIFMRLASDAWPMCAQVDPIVASFTGGAVGVISMLLLVEVNNVKMNAKARCVYCSGTGYLPCAQCGARGKLVAREGGRTFCSTCSGTGKVMCTSCLCTGMAMATEHDARIDPFGK